MPLTQRVGRTAGAGRGWPVACPAHQLRFGQFTGARCRGRRTRDGAARPRVLCRGMDVVEDLVQASVGGGPWRPRSQRQARQTGRHLPARVSGHLLHPEIWISPIGRRQPAIRSWRRAQTNASTLKSGQPVDSRSPCDLCANSASGLADNCR